MALSEADISAPSAPTSARAHPKYLAAPPTAFFIFWIASAMAAATGLALLYGFREPILETERIRYILILSLGLFALSRLTLFVPAWAIRHRLKSWWVDFILLAGALAWRITDAATEPLILKIAAIYSLAAGAGVLARGIITKFVEEYADSGLSRATFKIFLSALLVAIIGGAILSLPVCWANAVTGERTSQQAKHMLNCFFTATASLTGTGLAVSDIQQEFTHTGQIVIVVLMQIGGLAVLILAGIAAYRFYTFMGWCNEISQAGLMRLIRFVFGLTILCEAAGALLLYRLWDPAGNDNERILHAVFHAVSAFCNVGLTLPADALVGEASPRVGIIAILSGLMLLGSLGGPVLYDLAQRDGSSRFSKPTRVTLLGLFALTILGTALLLGIESTPKWQLRNPREDTPGRLRLNAAAEPSDGALVFSSEDTVRSRSQRMRSMPTSDRGIAAFFNTVSALGGGMPAARLDEASLSPASRIVLMTWMLIGGGLGGTAGGIRILMVYLILTAVCGRKSSPPLTKGGPGGVRVASILASMLLLVLITTLLLTYREAGSFEACTFEAISATCNAGLSTGLTPQLTVEGRVLLILSMLLGRVIPLGILFRPRE